MPDRKATLTAVLVDSVSGTAKHIKAEITSIGESAVTAAHLMAGIGMGIGETLFNFATNLIDRISDAFPKLVDSGNRYLEVLDGLQVVTGMTAEQTSLLVGTFRALAVPTETLQGLFQHFATAINTNEDRFRELGIATRDASGNLLGMYDIFQNTRRTLAEHSESLRTAAVSSELFGQMGFRILTALKADDAAWQAGADNARRWGGIVSQSAIDGAYAMSKSTESLSQGITDIGVQIASALDPYLRAFVDAFASFVQAHLQQIVTFAVGVGNAIFGFVAGLFGITDALNTSSTGAAESTKKATDATDTWGQHLDKTKQQSDSFVASVNAQIKAIDAHVHALQLAADRRRAIQERQRLADSLAAARSQLADLRGNAPFLGGLSAAEQALAVQKHAQDIIDAEKNVADRRQAIGDFEADQKDRAERELLNRQKARLEESLAAHNATNQAILQSGLRMAQGIDNAGQIALSNIGIKSEEIAATAAGAFKTGFAAAKSFLDVILGTETYIQTGASGTGYTTRVGGVMGALQSVGGGLKSLGDIAGGIGGILGLLPDAVGTVESALNNLMGWFTALGVNIHNFIVDQLVPILSLLNPASAFAVATNPWGHGHASGGWVGLHGPEMGLLGEKGPEYIVPHGGAMPGGPQIVVEMHNEFLSMPSDEQLHSLKEKISRLMALDLSQSPVSGLAAGSF